MTPRGPQPDATRKAEIFRLRRNGLTFREIAEAMEVSRQRISQILTPPKAVLRFIASKQDGKCLDCGIQCDGKGHVHHLSSAHDGIEDYNDLENLILLCPSCHQRRHSPIIISLSTPTDLPERWSFCKKCGYTWEPRVASPKSCPECKSRLGQQK